MEQLLAFLQSFHPLSPGLVNYLHRVLKVRELSAKELLLKAGRICRHLYFIHRGLLRCYYLNGDREICSWFLKERDVLIALESFALRRPSQESIQAMEDSTVFYISYEELEHIYTTYPEFHSTGRQLVLYYYWLLTQQLCGLRMKQAPERFQWLRLHHPDLIQRVPAKYLASWLGITEVMLSKVKAMKL